MRTKLSCIIPAYNEAARIAGVLAVALAHPLVADVLVVDDGSTDATAAVATAAGAAVLRLGQNGGKTRALAAGLARAQGDFVLLLDSDLIGLAAGDLTRLVTPVLSRQADVSISLRGNAPRTWRAIGLDYISGERVFPRAMLTGRLDELGALRRFGFEVHLNRLWLQAGARIAVVRWPGVASPAKARKHGLLRGIRADFDMARDVVQGAGALGLINQIAQMRRNRVADID